MGWTALPPEASGETPSSPLPASGGPRCPCFVATSLWSLPLSSRSCVRLCVHFIKTRAIPFRAQAIQDNLFISNSLTKSHVLLTRYL